MKSCLIVRFSAIGDCVMAVPVAAALRRAHPDLNLIWAVEELSVPVLDRHRLLSSLHLVPRDRWKRSRKALSTWREQLITYTRLRSVGLDLAIDLQGHSKTALLTRLSGAKRRLAGVATDALAARLNPLAAGDPEQMHWVDWNLEVLRQATGIEGDPEWIMPNVEPRWADVAISVGSSTADKRVPNTHWEAVGAALIAAGRSVTVLGGPRDPVPHIAGAENLVGKLSLSQSMEVAASAQLHLSGDTGMGHIAAAYGVPTVSVFGPMPPERYRPYGARGVVLRAASERPEDVSVEQILSACADAGVALA